MRISLLCLSALVSLLASSCIVIVSSSCDDQIRNGAETDVDCGGGSCGACPLGAVCVVESDCASGVCNGGRCTNAVVAASCTDGVLDGTETDIDCGGASCPACSDNRICAIGADCTSGVCTASTCRTASCHDGVQNGGETDVDCGGACTPCPDHPMGAGGNVPASTIETYDVKIGAGSGIAAGTQDGYGIEAYPNSIFRLIFTGYGQNMSMEQEFWGSIYTAGDFSNVTPGCSQMSCPPDANDFFSLSRATGGGHRLDFDVFAPSSVKGIDFTAKQPVYFDLYIDGLHQPAKIFFNSFTAGKLATAATIPFGMLSMQ